MKRSLGVCVAVLFLLQLASLSVFAQKPKPGLLSADELKKAVPSVYFFRGQSAPVQLRNSVGLRAGDDRLVLAGLVDTSGYASDVASKYQGFLINEVKIRVGDKELAPGQYGFGFSKDGRFLVMDVGADDLFTVATQTDDTLSHPVPLKLAQDGDAYRLYAGKKYVVLKAQ